MGDTKQQERQSSQTGVLSLEEQLLKAQESIAAMLTMDAAINLVPAMLNDKLSGALARKYAQKYGKLPAEQQAHRESFPAYAGNTAMLYMLVSAAQEATEKIASEERLENVSNLTSMVNSYNQAEVLTVFQSEQNKATDARIIELRDKVSNRAELDKLLGATRASWVKFLDYQYVRTQDNKLRRACHIFGTTLEAIAR